MKKKFPEAQAFPQALTFDDVLLVPGYAEVRPVEVETQTIFSRHVRLNIPISSAAMDTVTEFPLAIALARQGGIGIVHRNMSIERQAEEVDRVKRSESGMIVEPITIQPDQPIEAALELMKQFSISGIPVTEHDGKLVGILTNRDLRFETRHDVPVSQIMTKGELVTAQVGTSLEDAQAILHRHRVEKLLIVDDSFHLKGLITVKDIQKKIQYPNAAKDPQGRLVAGAAIGATGDYLERAQALAAKRVDVLVIDSAHGHTADVIRAVATIKARLSDVDVVAGNVATRKGAQALIEAGADAIKVGMGPGSICTTRVVSGCGMPQITAIMECTGPASEAGVPLIADGGIKYSGDITKAIAAGADSIMIGSLFAGCDESPGDTILYQGRSFKAYRGMGSLSAMAQGSAERYGQRSGGSLAKLVPEGIEARVPHKGALADVVYQMIGGLRAGMGYCGSRTIEELQQNAEFVRISSAGLRESHVHDVIITREAPNYQLDSLGQ